MHYGMYIALPSHPMVYEDGMDNKISMLHKGQALGFKLAIVTKEYSLCTTVYRKITVAIARAYECPVC